MSRASHGDQSAYIECDECGHLLEHHSYHFGCQTPADEPCRCPVRIRVKDVQDLRAKAGMARAWNRLELA